MMLNAKIILNVILIISLKINIVINVNNFVLFKGKEMN